MTRQPPLFDGMDTAAPATQGIKYAGSKLKVIPHILKLAREVNACAVLDGFSGSTRVSQALARADIRCTPTTLICLDAARPAAGWNTSRSLPEHAAHRAYEAWRVARADVADKWNFMADKANLEPDVPRALRRAAEIVRTSPPPEENQEAIDRAVDTLSAPYPERTVRRFRQAMNASTKPVVQARNILAVIKELGLEPYAPRSHFPRSPWTMFTW